MKTLFCCLLALFTVFAFCTDLRIEVQGDSTMHYQYQIDNVNTIFDLIDSCNIPYSLEYYQEFQTDYLRSFAGNTASGLNGWQYFKNWSIGTTSILETAVSDNDNVLIVYGTDFNHLQGIRPVRISTNVTCINQGENFLIYASYISPTGELLLSETVTIRLLMYGDQYEYFNVQSQNGQISFQINSSGIYELFIDHILGNNQYIRSNTLFVVVQESSDIEDNVQIPVLQVQNYPNPFNESTTIRYSLKSDEIVHIGIYNIKGQLVRTLVDTSQKSGEYKISWNSKNNNDEDVTAGIYFYKISCGKYSSTKKMILMK
ncbi:MAG: T9SS type A sorting domain-containing protein [Patescibacteria group bacterium]|nr:T9SS type A sorting domain-containing protein [Patescibacteria group bacterium]MDD4304828.1 T9SS type A sorting domain-containing protein [Patescibacteria group bacterium]MDD4695810.1 T9SS type A sorting domain-containing protein [Patescibacteria group bacterium]